MVPQTNHLAGYLREAAIVEIGEKYRNNGFRIMNEVGVGNIVIDMVAEKSDQKIFFEFKVRKDNRKSREELLEVKKLAAQEGAEYHLVYITPPPEVAVEIYDIDDKIRDYLEQYIPAGIQKLAPQSNIEEARDVEIDTISIEPNCITIKGTCLLVVSLQFSYGDISEGQVEDTFVTSFNAKLDAELNIISLDADVDTSSWDDYDPSS